LKSFAPLTPPKDQYMPLYGPIYPIVSSDSDPLLRRADVKGKHGIQGLVSHVLWWHKSVCAELVVFCYIVPLGAHASSSSLSP